MNFTLVTGNQGKLNEWKRLTPGSFNIDAVDIDLDEIQSLDLEEIITHKAKQAYEVIKKPVIVEDISAGISSLNGLPGPFIKFFIKSLGDDALKILSKGDDDTARVTCVIACYDGKDMLTVIEHVDGSIVSARGDNGFGFDKGFIPNGQEKTYGEMTPEEKDKISHRSKAIKAFASKIEA